MTEENAVKPPKVVMGSIAQDAVKYANLISEWHPTKNGEFTPKNVMPGSNKDIWWKCEAKGHEWPAAPNSRKRPGSGCPVCSGKQLLAGYNDLETLQPELSKQWHPTLNKNIKPSDVMSQSNDSAWWLCGVHEEHVWQANIQSRTKGNGCPYCANRKVLAGFNDLGSSKEYAAVASEWNTEKNEMTITEVGVASNKKVWWKCAVSGHEWEAIIANRTKKGSGCPECRKGKKQPKLDTVASDPLLASEWHPDNKNGAHEVTLGSNSIALWKCSKDDRHVWSSPISNRIRNGGCLVCSGKVIIAGINDLASIPEHQHLIAEWHPDNELTPAEVGVGTEYSPMWKCATEGHEWKATIYSRTKQKNGCPECSNRDPWSEVKRTIADFPKMLEQWHSDNDVDPATIPFSSRKKYMWQCPTNPDHVWRDTVSSRQRGEAGCPVCDGRVIIPGVNDLASSSAHAHLVKEWHSDNDFGPETVSVASGKTAKWQCLKNPNHLPWFAAISSRAHKKKPSGCPECARALRVSKGESEVFEIVKALGFDAKPSVRSAIPRAELDIYVPDKKFAIEFNGLYWHSEARHPETDYHVQKLAKCRKAGIELYAVWEDDWRLRRDIVIRDIATRLGATSRIHQVIPNAPSHWSENVNAGDLSALEIGPTEASQFFTNNHIGGGEFRAAYFFGLVDSEDRLRAVISASKTRTKGDFVMRYATAGEVEGGMDTLLAMVEAVPEVKSLTVLVDLSHGEGDELLKQGFTLEVELPEDYTYMDKGERHNRASYRPGLMKKNPAFYYEDGMTEKELAAANGLLRIWDYGNKRFRKEL